MKRTLSFNYILHVIKLKTTPLDCSSTLKKLIANQLIRRFLITVICILTISPAGATIYYVSYSSGNDANLGTTTSQAWKTLDKVNSFTPKPGDKILFKKGDVWNGTINIKASGSSFSPITYGAYGTGDNPIISGYLTLSGWTNEGGGIYSKVLSIETAPNILLIDNVQHAIGRYPNNSNLKYESSSSNISITDNQLSSTPNWTGAEAVIFKNIYTLDRCKITNHAGATIAYTNLGTTRNATPGLEYFIQNDLKTLDQFGEWYFDENTKKLFVFFGSYDPAIKTTKISAINNLMINSYRDYIVVNSISFEGSNSSSVYYAGADYCEFNNCNISNSGYDAFTLYGNNIVIDNCSVYNVNGGGIVVNGTNAIITNNTLSNIGIIPGQTNKLVSTCAMTINGNNPEVRYNKIDNTAYMGIYFTVAAITGIIQYNTILHTCRISDDSGSIYLGHDHPGTIIDHNIILYSGGNGIYLDEYCTGVTVSNNTLAASADNSIKLHKASGNLLKANSLYNNFIGINFTNWTTEKTLYNNIVSDNIIFAKSGQYATELINRFAGDNNFGTADSNYYARSDSDSQVFIANIVGSNSKKTFSEWQSVVNTDAHSKDSPQELTGENEVFYYNDSSTPNTFSLSNPMIDLMGTKYSTSLKLQPYTSKVLIKDPNPILPDESSPSITEFNVPTTYNSLVVPVINFSAIDNKAVTGYKITETAIAPLSTDDNWMSSAPTSVNFTSEGTKTIYAWVKDAAGNVSESLNRQVVITIPVISPTFSEYLFEEKSGITVIDSKSSIDGIIINEESRVEGAIGNGLLFTGTGYIKLGQTYSDNVVNELSLSAWIKPFANSSQYQGIIMHGGPNTDTYALYVNSGTKTIGFKTSGTTNSWSSISNVEKLWDTDWHLVTVTYNGSEKNIYLDGELILNVDAIGDINSGNGYNLYIGAGRDAEAPTLLYEGHIDEVRIYNYALNEFEVKDLYNLFNKISEPVYTNEEISICDGYSYQEWTTEGIYERTLTAASGADSIVTTYLTVNPTYNISENISINEGDSYNGWTESGEYSRNLISIFGCDSIVTTFLIVLKPIQIFEEISICEGNSYNGWSENGIYQRTFTSSNGADSIVTTNLMVNPIYNITEEITIKEGANYHGWTETGIYQRNLSTIFGCDSIVTTNLTIVEAKLTYENIDICEGENYLGWTSTGQYERVLTATSGADSIVITKLWVHLIYNIVENIMIYEGETYMGWSASGTYQRNLQTVYGCDSIVLTNLEVIEAIIIFEDVEICDGNSYLGWTESGQYQRILKAKSGGDSIVITNLWVNPSYDITEEIFINDGEDYFGWTDSGEYERFLTSIYGCDSVVTTILTVISNPDDTNISIINETTQLISLKKGWNIFSSNVVPDNANMDYIMAQLIEQGNLILVQDENGNTFENLKSTAGWNNNIGELKITEGYEIQVNSNCVLAIGGKSLDIPVNIELRKGWNIISFPFKGTVDALQVFQPLINTGYLDKVLDEKGNSIEYWRNRGWINKIGNLEAGEGYKVLVNADAMLQVNNLNQKTSIITSDNLKTEHFNTEIIENGFCHMNIHLLGLNETNLNKGDEVAVFDGSLCVGAHKISDVDIKNNSLSITTSANDNNMINGFYEGQAILIKYWNSNTNIEVEMNPCVIDGALTFQKLSSAFIILNGQTTSSFDISDKTSVDIYPNPATTNLTVRFSELPEMNTEIILLDITGKQIEKRKAFSNYEIFDVHSLPSGLYFLKTSTGSNWETKKVIIN